MSTPQNPNSDSDAENNQIYPSDQNIPDPGQSQDPAAGEQPDATQSYAGSAQYGQGSQFSQAEQYNQADQYNQQDSYGQQNQYGQEAQYNPANQYAQPSQQGQPGQPGQPSQQGQYYQGGDYAAYNQGNYAGSQHPPVDAYGQQGTQRRAGFFKSLFDFRFDNFIAVRWAGFIYIIAIIVAALSWLGAIIGGIVTGAAAGAATSYFSDSPSFSPWPLLLAIIFGWIMPALWVIFVRLALELIVANVKTAENTKQIADSLGR